MKLLSVSIWLLTLVLLWPGTLTGANSESPNVEEAMRVFLLSQAQQDAQGMRELIADVDDLLIVIEGEELHPPNREEMAEFLLHELGGSLAAVVEDRDLRIEGNQAILTGNWTSVYDYFSEFYEIRLLTEFHWVQLDEEWRLHTLNIIEQETRDLGEKPLYPEPFLRFEDEFVGLEYPSFYSVSEYDELILLDIVAHRKRVELTPGDKHQESLNIVIHDQEYASAAEAAIAFQQKAAESKSDYQLIDEFTVEIAGMDVPGHQVSYELLDQTQEKVRYFVAGDEILLEIYGSVLDDRVTHERLERLIATLEVYQ